MVLSSALPITGLFGRFGKDREVGKSEKDLLHLLTGQDEEADQQFLDTDECGEYYLGDLKSRIDAFAFFAKDLGDVTLKKIYDLTYAIEERKAIQRYAEAYKLTLKGKYEELFNEYRQLVEKVEESLRVLDSNDDPELIENLNTFIENYGIFVGEKAQQKKLTRVDIIAQIQEIVHEFDVLFGNEDRERIELPSLLLSLVNDINKLREIYVD